MVKEYNMCDERWDGCKLGGRKEKLKRREEKLPYLNETELLIKKMVDLGYNNDTKYLNFTIKQLISLNKKLLIQINNIN